VCSSDLISPGVTQAICLRRLVDAGRLRRLRRNLYVVVDPARETPPLAVADGAFAGTEHYVTTDAALAFDGLIDQPIPIITVVVPRRNLRGTAVGGSTIRPVDMAPAAFAAADRYATTTDGFTVTIATRVQAVLDALAEPKWMSHASLLPEILAAFEPESVRALAEAALARSRAAAQRLGHLLEDAGQEVPEPLARFVPRSTVELRPGHRSGIFSTRWRVHG
jgi:predicted transcriptional regulator of viral defense system